MRAITVDKYVKGVNELAVSLQSDPTPDLDQYEIEIQACAANFFDLLQIRGKYQTQPPLPWVAGFEFAGVILSIPKTGKPRFSNGDRVFGAAQGAYATRICAKDSELQPIPDEWGFEDAAGLYFTGPTSYAALKLRANIQDGEWVLIHGAAGGIGLSAIQIAKALGGKVIASTTSPSNIAACRSHGADFVIDYVDTPCWEREVQRITGDHGTDIVLDPVGLISRSLKCSAWSARLITIGFAGGNIEVVAANRILLKNVSIVGLHWGAYVKYEPEAVPEVWKQLFGLIRQGQYRGIVYRPDGCGLPYFRGLEDIPRALRGLEERTIWGKAVIKVSQTERVSRI